MTLLTSVIGLEERDRARSSTGASRRPAPAPPRSVSFSVFQYLASRQSIPRRKVSGAIVPIVPQFVALRRELAERDRRRHAGRSQRRSTPSRRGCGRSVADSPLWRSAAGTCRGSARSRSTTARPSSGSACRPRSRTCRTRSTFGRIRPVGSLPAVAHVGAEPVIVMWTFSPRSSAPSTAAVEHAPSRCRRWGRLALNDGFVRDVGVGRQPPPAELEADRRPRRGARSRRARRRERR